MKKVNFALIEKTDGPWKGSVWRNEMMTQAEADRRNKKIEVMKWERRTGSLIRINYGIEQTIRQGNGRKQHFNDCRQGLILDLDFTADGPAIRKEIIKRHPGWSVQGCALIETLHPFAGPLKEWVGKTIIRFGMRRNDFPLTPVYEGVVEEVNTTEGFIRLRDMKKFGKADPDHLIPIWSLEQTLENWRKGHVQVFDCEPASD